MAWAVVSSFTGAAKSQISVSGTSYDVYTFTSGGSFTLASVGDV
jgi:hypothetical protein